MTHQRILDMPPAERRKQVYHRYATREIAHRTGLREDEVRGVLKAAKLTGRYPDRDLHDGYAHGRQPRYGITQAIYDEFFAEIERQRLEARRVAAEAQLLEKVSAIQGRHDQARRIAQRAREQAMSRAQRRRRRTGSRRPPFRPAYRLRNSAKEVSL